MLFRVMYVVQITVPLKIEEQWNNWHNREHIPRVLAQPGFLQVRKFRSISNDPEQAEYVVLYELQNQTAYSQYAKSEEGARLRQEYLDAYGPQTKVSRHAWQETFHLIK